MPNESEEYLSKREELRLAEIELRNQRERVAELRRKLPKGPAVQEYIFEEVAASLDSIHHSYTGHPWLSSDIKERGIDELVPIWNILDLTRQGRGEFYAKLEYPQAA